MVLHKIGNLGFMVNVIHALNAFQSVSLVSDDLFFNFEFPIW